MADPPIGVILMALGGPDSLDAVEPFLANVRHGRPTPEEMVAEFRERYRRIGGKSPLLDISTAQARALEERLNRSPGTFHCYVGMRHWVPYIRDTVARMRDDGIARAVALCLTPYDSGMSVGAYLADLDGAIQTTGALIEIERIRTWHDARELIDVYAANAGRALATLAEEGDPDPVVLFTAHSLPQKIMNEGDPYERELKETMAAILKQLPPVRSRLCYQSAGRTGERWLGPPLEEVLNELARAGERAVLVVPFGFVSDHLEILYDIDIEAKARARTLGMRLERSDSPNVDPRFIAAIEGVVRRATATRRWT